MNKAVLVFVILAMLIRTSQAAESVTLEHFANVVNSDPVLAKYRKYAKSMVQALDDSSELGQLIHKRQALNGFFVNLCTCYITDIQPIVELQERYKSVGTIYQDVSWNDLYDERRTVTRVSFLSRVSDGKVFLRGKRFRKRLAFDVTSEGENILFRCKWQHILSRDLKNPQQLKIVGRSMRIVGLSKYAPITLFVAAAAVYYYRGRIYALGKWYKNYCSQPFATSLVRGIKQEVLHECNESTDH